MQPQYIPEPYFPQNLDDFAPWVTKHGLLVPYGKCQCGCGQDTPISPVSHYRRGVLRNHPCRFIISHNSQCQIRAVIAPDSRSDTFAIPLTQGKVAHVDAVDYEWLMQWKWHAQWDGKNWYATRTSRVNGNRVCLRMHRLIMDVDDPSICVDHKDGDGLNNTRDNLRRATVQQNNHNQHGRRDNKTGYIGVAFHKDTEKFQASIAVDGKSRYIGLFATAREAAIARDAMAIKLHGEFAVLNNVKRGQNDTCPNS